MNSKSQCSLPATPFLYRNWERVVKGVPRRSKGYTFYHNLQDGEEKLRVYEDENAYKEGGQLSGSSFSRLYIQGPSCAVCLRVFVSLSTLFLHCATTHPHYAFYHRTVLEKSAGSEQGIRSLLIFCVEAPRGRQALKEATDKRCLQGCFSARSRAARSRQLLASADLNNLLDEESAETLKLIHPAWKEHIRLLVPCLRQVTDLSKPKGKPVASPAPAFVQPPADRIYYHASTGEEIGPEDPESEEESKSSWLCQYEERVIDKHLELCDSDKAFFKVWNAHVNAINPKRAMPTREMYSCCIRFCKEKAPELVNLRQNLVYHLLTLVEYHLLSPDDVYNITIEYDLQQTAHASNLYERQCQLP